MLNVGGDPKVVVSTAAFHAGVRGLFLGLCSLKEAKMFLPHPLEKKLSIVGSLRDREVTCSTSDFQGFNFESCVWRAVSSHSFHHPLEVLVAQFNLYVHKSGLKPNSFHLIFVMLNVSTKRYRDKTQVSQQTHVVYNLHNAVPTSSTLGRRCINVIQKFCVCWGGVSDYNDNVIYWTVSVKNICTLSLKNVLFYWKKTLLNQLVCINKNVSRQNMSQMAGLSFSCDRIRLNWKGKHSPFPDVFCSPAWFLSSKCQHTWWVSPCCFKDGPRLLRRPPPPPISTFCLSVSAMRA